MGIDFLFGQHRLIAIKHSTVTRCHPSFFLTMSWFNKRKERNLIPPVESENSDAGNSSLNSHSTSDVYSSRSAATSPSTNPYADIRDRYQRNNPVDVYSRGQGNLDNDRTELFAGHNPNNPPTGRFAYDGPTLREPAPGEENEEDVEGIKQQTRFVKQESVNSTRNAIRMAREAEETARNTVNRLGSQSGASKDKRGDVPSAYTYHTVCL